MQDAWRSYVELALGITEASRKKALKVAKKLTKSSGVTVEQLQQIAEDLTETSAQNREAMVKLIRYELDRALGAIGLATADEVADLTDRIRDLEVKLADAEARAKAAEQAAAAAGRTAEKAATAPAAAPAERTPATTAAKKAPAKKAAPKKTAAKKTAAKKTAARKAPAKKTSSAGEGT